MFILVQTPSQSPSFFAKMGVPNTFGDNVKRYVKAVREDDGGFKFSGNKRDAHKFASREDAQSAIVRRNEIQVSYGLGEAMSDTFTIEDVGE